MSVPCSSVSCSRDGHRSPRRSALIPIAEWATKATGFLVLLSLAVVPAHAVSYASSVSNGPDHVSFRLNEPADQVTVIAGSTTNNLGPLPAGMHSIPMVVSPPFQVTAFRDGPVGFITPTASHTAALLPVGDSSVTTRFNDPRGIAINTDPASLYFGRVYIANSATGEATNSSFGPRRQLGDGLYVLNPDLSEALDQGNAPLTGGLEFNTNSDLAPYRLTLGRDGHVYICDFSQASGSLYVVDPDVTPGSGTNVLGGPAGGAFPVGMNRYHGSIAAVVVEGTLSSQNLTVFTIDEDLQSDPTTPFRTMLNSLWRHDVGGQLPGPPKPPELVLASPWFRSAGQTMDLCRGPTGIFYVTDYRATGLDRAGLYAVTPEGTLIWNSLEQTRELVGDPNAPDLLTGTAACAISSDGRWLALIQQDTCVVTVLPLIAGLPELASRLSFAAFGGPMHGGRDLAFDAAGNLWVLGAEAQALRVFSPGGRTTAITGSDGSFTVARPPRINVRASVPVVMEGTSSPATFTFHREPADGTELAVAYELGGTAGNGVQYQLVPLEIHFPPGQAEVELLLQPIDDGIPEATMDVTLTLAGSPAYDIEIPSSAVVWITDNDVPVVQVQAIKSSAMERFAGDRLIFEVARIGQTNTELAVRYDLALSSAVLNADFRGVDRAAPPSAIHLAPGQLRMQLIFEVMDDLEFEGTENVVLRLLPGLGYQIGRSSLAIAYILDDEVPPSLPSTRLFEEDFESDGSSSNWVVRFGANNGIYDAQVDWQFDYTQLGIPTAPSSKPGDIHGLFVQVNKTNALAGGSCGINFYLKDRVFSGDYALCFDLFVSNGLQPTDEHALAGLNHGGLFTNRVTQSLDPNGTTRGGDGVWLALGSDGSDLRNCAFYSVDSPGAMPSAITNLGPGNLSTVFPAPPYGIAGAPGVFLSAPLVWTQVELAQIAGRVLLKLNNQTVCSLTNRTGFTNGTVLIGLNDQFDSIGAGGVFGNFVIFDNVRVVNYALAITGLFPGAHSGELEVRFRSPAGGPLDDFALESTDELNSGVWQTEASAVILPTTEGYTAVLTELSAGRFFRVRRGRLPP